MRIAGLFLFNIGFDGFNGCGYEKVTTNNTNNTNYNHQMNQMNQTLHCASHPVHLVHLVTKKKFVIFVLSVGKRKKIWFIRFVW